MPEVECLMYNLLHYASIAALAQVCSGHDRGSSRKWLRQKGNAVRLPGSENKIICIRGGSEWDQILATCVPELGPLSTFFEGFEGFVGIRNLLKSYKTQFLSTLIL